MTVITVQLNAIVHKREQFQIPNPWMQVNEHVSSKPYFKYTEVNKKKNLRLSFDPSYGERKGVEANKVRWCCVLT